MSEVLTGIGVVAGNAVGRIKLVSLDLSGYLKKYTAGDAAGEKAKLDLAFAQAEKQLSELAVQMRESGQKQQADILEAHKMMLLDPELKSMVEAKMGTSMSAPQAVLAVAEEYAAVFDAMEDSYMRERAADIRDIGRRIVKNLLGVTDTDWGTEPVIVCAADLEPSALANLPAGLVQGVALEHGSTTSHAVIIAKARGIPAIVGLKGLARLKDGEMAALNGSTGELILSPDAVLLKEYTEQIQKQQEKAEADRENAALPAVTTDGVKLQLAANVGRPQDMEKALELGCEGVGLYRTEFLFMERDSMPGEEEQFAAYRQVAQQCGANLCIIRTMDIGGDKPLSYLDIGQENNPFLGWRALRISLVRTDLFITQLKAILRAGCYGKVAVMLPMVISLDEIRRAKECLAKAIHELEQEGKQFDGNVPFGIMVETPAAAVSASILAKECDFFSIGTNDLTQYTLAVDRGNPKVSGLYNPFHPAVLQLIQRVLDAARDNGIWAGMCGEMAGDPLAAVLLAGMGIDELSMSATALPRVREKIRSVSIIKARELARQALQMEDGAAIREYLQKELE